MFNALHLTPFDSTRVVILGQDPYHGPHQAHGLAFSVRQGIAIPPSLTNIFKELRSDLGVEPPPHGCLESWARQGVLLLNSTLTVRAGVAGSHSGKGWETFTDAIIRTLGQVNWPIIFVLWGNYARRKRSLITQPHHSVIESAHPPRFRLTQGSLDHTRFRRSTLHYRSTGVRQLIGVFPKFLFGVPTTRLSAMASIRRQIFIDCDAQKVWDFVGSPDRLHEWFPIASTRVEGSKRWITLNSGITFEEDIITLDHDLRRFQYKIVNNPLITFHQGTVDVIDDGHGGCMVMYSTDMEPEVLALPIGGAAGVGLQRLREMFERKS